LPTNRSVRLLSPTRVGCYGLKSFSIVAFTASSILINAGQGRLKPSPGSLFVAPMPSFEPMAIDFARDVVEHVRWATVVTSTRNGTLAGRLCSRVSLRHDRVQSRKRTRGRTVNMKSRIQVSPDIHFGKPCVAGTRITVQNVLELVREGIPFDAIIRDYYPDLKVEDIKACIQYAIDVVQTEDIHVSAAS